MAPLFLFLVLAIVGCGRSGEVRLLMKLPAARGASGMAQDANGKMLAVACSRDRLALLYDLEAEPPTSRSFRTGGRPVLAAFDTAGGTLYLLDEEGDLVAVRVKNGTVVRRSKTAPNPTVLGFDSPNHVVLAGFAGVRSLWVLDSRSLRTLKRIALGGSPVSMSLREPEIALVATADADGLSRIRLIDRRAMASGMAQPVPRGLAVRKGEASAWVSVTGVSPSAGVSPEPALLQMRVADGRTIDSFPLEELPGEVEHWDRGFVVLEPEKRALAVYGASGTKKGDLDLGTRPDSLLLDVRRRRAYISLPQEGAVAVVRLPKYLK